MTASFLLDSVSFSFPHHHNNAAEIFSDRPEAAVEFAILVGTAANIFRRLAAIGVVIPDVIPTLENLAANSLLIVHFKRVVGSVREVLRFVSARTRR